MLNEGRADDTGARGPCLPACRLRYLLSSVRAEVPGPEAPAPLLRKGRGPFQCWSTTAIQRVCRAVASCLNVGSLPLNSRIGIEGATSEVEEHVMHVLGEEEERRRREVSS